MNSPLTFGGWLKRRRGGLGLTQKELAQQVGYAEVTLRKVEADELRPCREMAEKLAEALEIAPEDWAQFVRFARDEPGWDEVALSTQVLPAGLPSQSTASAPQSDTLLGWEQEWTLPIPPTELVGRTQEVKLIVNRLVGHTGRLLTLVGPPGIGKTRLGLAVADKLQAVYKDGVYFVPLAALHHPDLLASTLMSALPISESGDKPPTLKLIEFLRRKEVLLLLDNFEQIKEAAPLLAELLATCPGLRVLVTSRERLHLRAEQLYRVASLELASAVTLFAQRAQALDADFAFTTENQPILAEICQRLDCLPLAIELSAARIDLFTPQVLLARLQDQRLALLTDGSLDLPPQQRTLRHAIRRSYELLNDTEQALLRMLGVFAGGFDLAAVTHFGFDEVSLHSLLHKSLVQAELGADDPRRFLLLETIREFALEQLGKRGGEEAGELLTMQRRHAEYFLGLAEQLDPTAESSAQTYWIQRLKLDYDNLRAALAWTMAHKAVEMALRFVWALRWYWDWFDWRSEARHWIEPIVTLAEQRWSDLLVETKDNPTELSRQQLEYFTRALCAWAEFNTEALGENERIMERCRVLNQRCGLSLLTPIIYHKLAAYHRQRGDYEKHDALHLECLQLLPLIPTLDERTQNHETASSFRMLGDTAFDRGDLDRAEHYYRQAQQLFTELGNKIAVASTILDLSDVACYRGQVTEAQQLMDSCWDEFVNAGHSAATIWLHERAGHLALRAGDVVKAATLLCKGLQLLARSEAGFDPTYEQDLYYLLRPLTEVALAVGQPELAARLVGAADRLLHTYQLLVTPIVQPEIEKMIAQTSTSLGEAEYQKAYAAGYGMSTETVVSFTLKMLLNTSGSSERLCLW